MYNKTKVKKTTLKKYEVLEGETIEMKVRRIVHNKEPITDGAPIVFTDRKDGVLPLYDIRTDRFELAVDATDTMTKSHLANRENRHAQVVEMNPKQGNGGAEPIQATT